MTKAETVAGVYIKECIITEYQNTIITSNQNNANYSTGIGGIVGNIQDGNSEIINSCNIGNVNGKLSAVGIVGTVSGAAWSAELNTNINNCYNIGEISAENISEGIVGKQDTVSNKNYLYINNSYCIGVVNGK